MEKVSKSALGVTVKPKDLFPPYAAAAQQRTSAQEDR
jgi:hypothetical protein